MTATFADEVLVEPRVCSAGDRGSGRVDRDPNEDITILKPTNQQEDWFPNYASSKDCSSPSRSLDWSPKEAGLSTSERPD